MEKRERVIQFLNNNYAGDFIVSETPNENGKYEISSNGKLKLMNYNTESLTTDDFVFTKVNYFNCNFGHSLKSLKGAPGKVEEFYCNNCHSLQTLEGAPKEVKEFYCGDCKSLKSLKGAPKKTKNFNYQGCSSLRAKTNVLKTLKLKF